MIAGLVASSSPEQSTVGKPLFKYSLMELIIKYEIIQNM
jgi:hypothetical protein